MGGRPLIKMFTVLCLVAMLAQPAAALAERLAARRYSTADGLAGDYIIHAMRDSRGFLWFSTRDGLSRFDGVRFVTYGMADGLPTATVNHLLETRAGVYWVATNGGGLCRFNAQGVRGGTDGMFVRYRISGEPATNRVNVTFEDRSGRLWLGTDSGLFVMRSDGGRITFERVHLPPAPDDRTDGGVSTIVEDDEGSLWVGIGYALMRRLPDGRAVMYRPEPPGVTDAVSFVEVDRQRRLWVGFRSGLLVLEPAPAASFTGPGRLVVRTFARTPTSALAGRAADGGGAVERARWYTTSDGLPDNIVMSAYLLDDGRAWIGTARGAAEFDGRRFVPHDAARGLPDNQITKIIADSAGGLWFTSVTGAVKVLRNGLVTYDRADGLPDNRIHSIMEDASGGLLVVSGNYEISRLIGSRFVPTRPALPAVNTCGWLSGCAHLDRSGDWWVSTSSGLFRWSNIVNLSDIARRPPRSQFRTGSGLSGDNVLSTFEDRDGNLWISTVPGGLTRWERATGKFDQYGDAAGLPPMKSQRIRPSSFAEDRAGNLWVGFDPGGLARRRDGQFQAFLPEDGAPLGTITALHLDRAGRMWIASSQAGLVRVDDPSAARPVFRSFTTTAGLASDNVRCLTEDDRGRLYAGTSRGVDRIDPVSGAVKHFSVVEGLASDFMTAAFRDRSGALWFGTIAGLSRLDPAAEVASPAARSSPAVFISSLRVAGSAERVSELGETAPAPLTLGPTRNQLEVGFFGLSFESGEPLKYQYRLDGADTDWSPATELRSVQYASLSSGSYRFMVRAIRQNGVASTTPAVISFSVLPPFYARWWFISLLALGAGALGLVLYRARVAQLLRVERVRSRIATDLHDDIGASLSQIAILAEVARERMSHGGAERAAAEPLERIAETSRGLVDSMSDIVWAINPEVDTLSDLVHRMRRFAEDTLGASDIEVQFRAPMPAERLKLGPDVRREVFLILKETVTNIAKHANCTRVAIDFDSDWRRLWLRAADNGQGFDPAEATDGNGMASMRRRVAALGGHLVIDSAPGRGTTIEFDIDLRATKELPQ